MNHKSTTMGKRKLSLQNKIRKDLKRPLVTKTVKNDRKEYVKFKKWLTTLDKEERIEDFFDEEAIEDNAIQEKLTQMFDDVVGLN